MAIITIELNDLVADTINKKIDEIGSSAKFASAYVSDLSNAVKSLDGKNLSALSQSITNLASQVKRANESHKELADTIEKSNKIYTQNQIQINKVNESKAKEEIANNRLFLSETKVQEALDRTSIKRQKQIEDLRKVAIASNAYTTGTSNSPVNESKLASTANKLKSLGLNLGGTGETGSALSMEVASLKAYLDKLPPTVEKAGASLLSFSNIFKAYLAIRGAGEIIRTIDAYTLMENRLKLVSTSQENTNQLQGELFSLANTSRVAVTELTQAFVRYDYAIKGLGGSQQESIRFTKTLTEQLAISGLTTTEQSSAMLQLSQALNKGKLDGDEFRTVMETLPTLATAIAKQMGVARGELIALAPEGKITAQVIRDAMASIASDTDKAFKDLTPTIGQAFTVLNNKVIETTGTFNQFAHSSELVANSIIFISNNLTTLAPAIVASMGLITYTVVTSSAVMQASLTRLSVTAKATFASLLSPIILIPALVALGFSALISAQKSANDQLDIDNENKRIAYESLRISQKENLGLLAYETEATKKIAEETKKYTELILLNKQALAKGFISKEQAKESELNTPLGKSRDSANSLINRIPSDLKTNADKTKERLDQLEKDYTKEIAIAQSFETELLKVAEKGGKDILAQEARIAKAKQDAIANQNSGVIELSRVASGGKSGIRDADILKIDREVEGLKKVVASQKEINDEVEKQKKIIGDLKDAKLKEESLIRNENILKIMVKVTNDLSEIQDQYNNTLEATERLKNNGIINAGQEALLIKETTKAKNDQALQDNIYNATFHTSSDSRIRAINKERESVLLLIEANRKKTDTQEDFDRINAQKGAINSNADRQIFEVNRADRIKGQFGTVGSDLDGSKAYAQANEAQRIAYEEQVENARARDAEILKNTKIAGKEEEEVKKANTEKKREIDNQYASAQLALGATTASALQGLAEKFAQGHSKRAHIAFEISKGLAYAEAVLNMASAIARANAESSIYTKALAIGTAIAIGSTQIATIKNADAKFARGGFVSGSGSTTSDSIPAMLSNKEFVVNARSTAKYRNELERINSEGNSNSSGGSSYIANSPSSSNSTSGGGVNVNVYNTAGVSVETKTTKNDDGSQNIDLIVSKIDAKLAQNYSQNLGQLTGVVKGNIARKY